MRVIFMGTPEFATRALVGILESPHEVVAVYTQPPRPAGRGQGEKRSPVHDLAAAKNIPVYSPVSLRDKDAQKQFADLVAETKADIAVVAAYGLILPPQILTAPPKGCINIHASLLPRWRGAAPIQRAILAGDEKTGITIMQMDEGLDTGPMLAADEISIGPAVTAVELHDRLAVLGGRMVVYVLNGIEGGVLEAAPQPEAGVTYAEKLTREEGRLDWNAPASELERKIRAFWPWPGAWFEYAGTRIKVMEAHTVAAAKGVEPGQVLDGSGRLTIACGAGSLRITRLQREGRKVQDVGEFLRGFAVDRDVVLP